MLKRKEINTDLCVIGGGIAGVVTAISAARSGINVVLMQERPVLGGNASSEIRMWICGASGSNMRETGIVEEILLRSLYYNPTKNPYIFDNILLEMVTCEENITLLLNCTCMEAKTEKGKYEYGRDIRIKAITGYQMTTQMFYDVEAAYFADCSGDSILAPLTGAQFTMGRECADDYGEETHVKVRDNLTMGNSCLIQARQTEKSVPFVPLETATDIPTELLTQRNTDLYEPEENFWYLELGGSENTISDSEEIGHRLRNLAYGVWKSIKENKEYRAENFDLEFIGALPGKRESRRYIGEYIMKQQDISSAVRFDDTVAYGGWPIDDHYPDGFYHKGVPNTDIKTDVPYPIPYRILYSVNVDNLFFAGRNISATHCALSSLRVMATCGVMGQAVGVAASLAVKYGISPHGVYEKKINELKEQLLDNDCFLPYVNRRVSELCRKTPVEGGCELLKNGEDRPNKIYGNKPCGADIKNGQSCSYIFKEASYVEAVHLVFDSDLDRTTLPGGTTERRKITRCNIMLDSPNTHMPKTLCKEFVLSVTYADGSEEEMHIKDNKKRSYHIPIKKDAARLTLTPCSNWGGSDTTGIFSFDFK